MGASGAGKTVRLGEMGWAGLGEAALAAGNGREAEEEAEGPAAEPPDHAGLPHEGSRRSVPACCLHASLCPRLQLLMRIAPPPLCCRPSWTCWPAARPAAPPAAKSTSTGGCPGSVLLCPGQPKGAACVCSLALSRRLFSPLVFDPFFLPFCAPPPRHRSFPKNQKTFARVTGYVEQEDVHLPQVRGWAAAAADALPLPLPRRPPTAASRAIPPAPGPASARFRRWCSPSLVVDSPPAAVTQATVVEALAFSATLRLPSTVDAQTRTDFIEEVRAVPAQRSATHSLRRTVHAVLPFQVGMPRVAEAW